MKKILFVCMGNICRSPTAQGVFENKLAQLGLTGRYLADSAGTHSYHVGSPPDRRAVAAASARGIDISHQHARQVSPADFDVFDMLVAMDENNYRDLLSLCAEPMIDKVHRMMDFASNRLFDEVPDPYYGGENGFERVLDLLEDACEGLIAQLERKRP